MKKLMIKVGEYTDKEGNQKGEWVRVGVILESQNGEYVMLDPSVNLAGCLIKQRVMNAGKQNKGKGDMVMCSIFTDQPQQQPQQQSQPQQPQTDFDDDIPF